MEPATPNSIPTISPQRDPEDLPLHATGHVHHLQDAAQAGPQLEGDTGATAGINTRLKYSLCSRDKIQTLKKKMFSEKPSDLQPYEKMRN